MSEKNKERLPREEAVRTKLNRCASLMEACGFRDVRVVQHSVDSCYVRVQQSSVDVYAGNPQYFRPEIKPVPYGRGVWVREDGVTFPVVSKGDLGGLGAGRQLTCVNLARRRMFTHWCSMEDPTHHSAGWKLEWLAEVAHALPKEPHTYRRCCVKSERHS